MSPRHRTLPHRQQVSVYIFIFQVLFSCLVNIDVQGIYQVISHSIHVAFTGYIIVDLLNTLSP